MILLFSKFGEARADHFSDHLLKGYHGDISAFEILMSNTGYPDIARATALNQYSSRGLSQQEVQNLLQYLNDSSAMVRNETIFIFRKKSKY